MTWHDLPDRGEKLVIALAAEPQRPVLVLPVEVGVPRRPRERALEALRDRRRALPQRREALRVRRLERLPPRPRRLRPRCHLRDLPPAGAASAPWREGGPGGDVHPIRTGRGKDARPKCTGRGKDVRPICTGGRGAKGTSVRVRCFICASVSGRVGRPDCGTALPPLRRRAASARGPRARATAARTLSTARAAAVRGEGRDVSS